MKMIRSRQKTEGWGAKVIDRLSNDLQKEFPGQQGFSPRNLKYMRAFAQAWPDSSFVQQPAAQIPSIGLILCRAKNRILAEYALRDMAKPIGVSDYVTRLVETLPESLQAAVPSIEEIEKGLASAADNPTPQKEP